MNTDGSYSLAVINIGITDENCGVTCNLTCGEPKCDSDWYIYYFINNFIAKDAAQLIQPFVQVVPLFQEI